MINLDNYKNEPEFQTAVKEMLASLDPVILNDPKYQEILDDIVNPDHISPLM